MLKGIKTAAIAAALTISASAAHAAPIYADTLVTSFSVTSFGSGLVTGAPDGGGLFLGSDSDPPTFPGGFTVGFSGGLGNGAGADLEIDDVASSSNETFSVEVSTDGLVFTLIGNFSATNSSVDFGSYTSPVFFVRLFNTSTTVSADIDALWGNYEPVTTRTPEPASLALLGAGLAGLALSRRRKIAA